MNQTTTGARNAARSSIAETLSWSRELRETFALAWPLVIAQLAQTALFTTDVVMMGWLGPKFLAAGTLATTFLVPFLFAGTGITGAVAPLVAQARGARNIKAVRRIVRQGFWASAIIVAVLTPLLLQIRPLYAMLGQDPDATILAEQFIQLAVPLLFPALGVIVLRSLLSAFNTTRIILVITVAGVLFNALCNYTLMFGNFGFPRLELRGSAISTLATNVLMFALFLIYVLTHHRFRRFHILHNFFKPDWFHLREIFRVGTPIGLTVLAEVGLFTAAALLMGRLGIDEVAAHAVALQCASLAFMIPLGLGIASTVRVGNAYGRGDPEGIRKAGWMAFILGTGFMAFGGLSFVLWSHGIVGLFLDHTNPANSNALTLAASFLVVAGVFQLADGAQVVAAHALRGMSDTTVPMIVAIIGYWAVGLPVAYILGFVANWRGVGIWIGLAAGLAFVAVVLVTRFAMRERLGLLRSRS
ncbi:MATE family efflux transporter [Devosia sp.]|uniref:MATE family efflux transporter n=1 Tax=Devosia sp. TaxID=1871048 RepID=UPI0032653120